jgi:ribokinase
VILVFGSYNFDVYVPRITSLPPLDAIDSVDGHTIAPGGKGGNQAVAVARAAGQPAAYGCVGSDALGTYLLDRLADDGVDHKGIVRSPSQATGMGLIFLDPAGGHRVVYAKGANAAARADDVPAGALAAASAVLVQGDVEMRENERLIERAADAGVPAVLTLGPAVAISLAALARVPYVLFNQREAGLFLDHCHREPSLAVWHALPSSPSPQDFCSWFTQEFGGAVVVTVGEEGAVACDRDGTSYREPALAVDVLDTVGAGDTFAGYFATAIAEQRAFRDALRTGVIAASLACRAVGAQQSIPTRAEVEAVLS